MRRCSCNRCCLSQGRNVVLESKYGSPRIVNDGVTVAKEVELEDPVENIGAKLVRQASSTQAQRLAVSCCILPCPSSPPREGDHATV